MIGSMKTVGAFLRASLTALVAATLHSHVLPSLLTACSCAPPPPPCQAYWQTPIVFLGTVTEALATRNGHITRARMRIDRAYKGVSEKTLVLFDDGMCDGPEMKVGEQYLMYTRRFGEGDVPSRGCTRSRHVKHADEDLEYLRALGSAIPTGMVFGKVVERTDDYYGNDKPAPGAKVEVSGLDRTFSTVADAEGRYSFANLEPAKYTIRADYPGSRMLSFTGDGTPLSTSVEAKGCAVVNLVMRREWRGAIRGQLFRASGLSAPSGLQVSLLRMDDRGGIRPLRALFYGSVWTDDQGQYLFGGLAPGRYKVAVQLYQFPTSLTPYPTIYWPTARSESDGFAIDITDTSVLQHIDFKLPPEPKGALVRGIVLSSDGPPAAGAQVQIVALPDNWIIDDRNRPQSDESGRFSFTAFEGFEYRLSARTETPPWRHSADLSFSLARGQRSVTLVLDRPGRFDNDPAERAQDRQPPP
jgi:hypothetical protein